MVGDRLPGPLGVAANTPQPTATKIDAKVRLLAATAVGEGSTNDVFEETVAIANARFAKLMKAGDDEIAKDPGLSNAIKAAQNALDPVPADDSNGAYFWDGADIKSKDVPGEEWWRDAKGKNTRLRGKWDYKYESTAAHGGTMFWKYNADFIQATSNKVYD